MTYREAICAALEDELRADPRVIMMGEDVASAAVCSRPTKAWPSSLPEPDHQHADLRERLRRSGDRHGGDRHCDRWSRSCSATSCPPPADAMVEELPKYRASCRAASARAGHGSLDRRRRPAASATQHSATGESWFMGLPGLLVARPGRRRAPTGCCARRSARGSGALHRAQGALRAKGPVVRGDAGSPRSARPRSCAGRDVTIVSTLLMADRALRPPSGSPATASRRGDRPAVASAARYSTPIRASVAKTGRLSSSRSRFTPAAGARR